MPTRPPRSILSRLAPVALALVWLGACDSGDPLEQARILQDERHDFTAPLESLRTLSEERPDDPEVQYRYGVALLTSNQPTLALWPLRRAARSPEWEERAHYALASAYLLAGSYDEAIEVIDGEIERDPENPYPLMLRANAYIQSRRNYEGALADADRVLELDPENTDVLPIRAIALLSLDRVEEAGEAIDQLDSAHRDEVLDLHGAPTVCTARAKFAEEKGDLEQAEKRYDDCLAQFPAGAGLVHEAVGFYDRQGRADRATEVLRAALDAMPGARSYRLTLASRLRAEGRDQEADAVLRAGTEHPEPAVAAEAWTDLARARIEAGEYDEAVAAYEQARRLVGPDDLLLFNYADALVIAERYDEALAMADGIGVPVYRSLVRGRVALGRGEPAQALAHFQEGIKLWPDNPYARYYAAVAAERTGDFRRAVEEYRYAMRNNAQATDAYLRLARLQDAAGTPDLALATLSFMPGARPSEREAALLELRLQAELGRAANTPPWALRELGDPAGRAAGAAALAEGVREHAGAEEALKTLRSVEGVDLGDPAQAEALASLIDLLDANGQSEAALAEVDRALRAHPEAAVFHALRGRALVALGRRDPARAAFERALDLDGEQRAALLGLAQLEAEAGAADAARALYERALAQDSTDAEALRGLAASLASLDRRDEAEERLAALLREHPYDSEAAMALAELRLARGPADDRTRELARRAVIFGGGDAAVALLERAGGELPKHRAGAAPLEDLEAPPAAEPESGSETGSDPDAKSDLG